MLDKNYSSKEWDKLWKELDTIKSAPSYAKQVGKDYQFKHSKLKTGDFGIGASMLGNYQDPVAGFQADIRKGMGHIEFNPAINGQGMKSFSKITGEKRRALREIKKVNEATIGTHADSNVFGLTGFDTQRYSFSEDRRHQNVAKIKEAIDFAAEVSEGGAITFHAGDFLRPIDGTNFGKGVDFSKSKEQKDMVLGIIDETSNEFVRESMVRPEESLTVAVKDPEHKIKMEGFSDRYSVPGFKPLEKENGELDVSTKTFGNFRQYAAWLYDHDENYKKEVDKKLNGNLVINNKGEKDKPNEISDYRALELAAKQKFIDDNKFQLLTTANNQFSQIGKQQREVEKLKKALDDAIEKSIEDDGEIYYIPKDMRTSDVKPISKSKLKASASSRDIEVDEESDEWRSHISNFIAVKNGKFIDENGNETSKGHFNIEGFYAGDYNLDHLDNRLNEIKFLKKNVQSQIEDRFQKLGFKDDLKDSKYKTISEMSQEQNKKSFGELGSLLYEKNKMLEKQGKDKMYFAIENIFPEHYGATPEELLEIIKTAKGAMSEELVREGRVGSKKDAKKIADQSIKATFDTGHLHMWKKHFRRKDKESDKDYDKRFNKWALEETKKLIKAGVIGNVHLADNFGHEDDHLSLGQGTVPIQEYMKMFDKARADGKITGKFSVEGGFDQGDNHGVHEAWKQSGVQIFRSQDATDKWVNLEDNPGHGYGFSQLTDNSNYNAGNKPYFVFGKYAPSQDPNDWAPWDEMGLE